MHIDEAKGRLKTRFQTAFILKVFRRRLRSSESLKQWFKHQKTRACVPHTPYVGFKVCAAAGRVCGAATHAVGEDTGYGLLPQSQTHRIIGQNLLPFIGYNRKKVSAAIAVKTTVFHSIMFGMIL